MNNGGFSWNRLLGITRLESNIGCTIGVMIAVILLGAMTSADAQYLSYEQSQQTSYQQSQQFYPTTARHYHANTCWSRLRRGMSQQQVWGLLGRPDIDFAFGDRGFQSWRFTDRCQGFDQKLWFSVEYRYIDGRWMAWDKDVDWMVEWWDGAGEYDHHDVSDEWQ